MKAFHIAGVLSGIVLISISKFFWLGACRYISGVFLNLDIEICNGFTWFFMIAGILSIIISITGHYRNK